MKTKIDDITFCLTIKKDENNVIRRVIYDITDDNETINNWFCGESLFRYLIGLEDLNGDFEDNLLLFYDKKLYHKIFYSGTYKKILAQAKIFFKDYVRITNGL